jgi:hypothetical protein
VKSNCPKFDPAAYLKDCNSTKASIPATCQMQFDSLANCIIGQQRPPPCTEDGAIDDTTPPACQSQANAVQSCK